MHCTSVKQSPIMKRASDLRFSLIVCTYERDDSLKRLLDSVKKQSLYPDEILIIDGSIGKKTEQMLNKSQYENLKYFRVEKEDRGLTRQRNYGIDKCGDAQIVCFLDDDILTKPEYFSRLIETYNEKPEAIAVGGWIKDETTWKKIDKNYQPGFNEFLIDGYIRKLGQRNVMRKRLGLLSDKPPGFMPEFSHGFSTGFLPPSGKTYEVEFFMGGVSSYRKELFQDLDFSSYFEGYGLYEDMDFCLRASRIGQLYVNTAAKVHHLHHESGRPDYFKYGKMVIDNGYHVWRLKFPSPGIRDQIKWVLINILLAGIRFLNGFKNRNALADAEGRFYSLLGLAFKKPKNIEQLDKV